MGSAQEIRFEGPLAIPNVPEPLAVQSGDFDGDGKLDLVTTNRTNTVTVLFQDPQDLSGFLDLDLPFPCSDGELFGNFTRS